MRKRTFVIITLFLVLAWVVPNPPSVQDKPEYDLSSVIAGAKAVKIRQIPIRATL